MSLKFPTRFVIYILLCSVPFFYRLKWNGSGVFVSSDPEIKYYQVVHLLEGGNPEECYFPAKKIGFSLASIPIGYPWAFSLSDGRCLFQYPILFTYLQWPMAVLFGPTSVTFLPILFFLINFLLLDRIFSQMNLSESKRILPVILIQCFSPIFLSSLDYSELTLTNFFLLVSVSTYLSYTKNFDYLLGSLFTIAVVFTFNLRPEVTISIVFFLGFDFLFRRDHIHFLKKVWVIALFAIFCESIFVFWNQSVFGHPLGMRGLSLLNDIGEGGSRNYLQDFVADLWKSDFKIGIFYGYPLLFLALGSFLLVKEKSKLVFLVAGFVFLLSLPFLSPYRAGVGIFGMRYFESGIYLFLIGSFSIFADRLNLKWFGLLLIPFLYFSYKSDLNAIKQWSSGAKMYRDVQDQIDQLKPDLIVQRGLSISYFMGESYTKYPQITVYSQEDWIRVEEVSKSKNLKILYLEWKDNGLVKDEFSERNWKNKFDISFKLRPVNYKVRSEHKLAHFDGILLEVK